MDEDTVETIAYIDAVLRFLSECATKAEACDRLIDWRLGLSSEQPA